MFRFISEVRQIPSGSIQMFEHKVNMHPVRFTSRAVTSAEKNYSLTNREMLVIAWAL